MESRKHTWSHLPKETKIPGGLEKVAVLFLTCDTPTFSLSPEYLLPTHPAALNLHTGPSKQRGESCRSQATLKAGDISLPSKKHSILVSSAQLGTAGAFSSSNSCVWLWQASPPAFASSPGMVSCRSGIRCFQPCFKEKQVLVSTKAPVRWEWCDCASQLTVLPGLDRIKRTIKGTISRASSSIFILPTEHNRFSERGQQNDQNKKRSLCQVPALTDYQSSGTEVLLCL